MNSVHNYKTEIIAEMLIQGGLTHPNRTQKTIIEYYYRESEKNPKVVIHFGIASKDLGVYTETSSSLRFEHYGELHSFIFKLIEAMGKIGQRTGEINPENRDYLIDRDLKLVNKAYQWEKL